MYALDYRPWRVCPRNIHVEVSDDGSTIERVVFFGGCNGNLKGIGALVEGMEIDDVISRVEGIHCGMKSTSCPDQLAQALRAAKNA
jgi:uncharacterized protein (TIGR03905 family)